VGEQLEEKNPDTAIRVLPEETLEENLIVEPSPKFHEPVEFIEDLAYLTQYPQDEVTSLIPIEDLSEINDSFFHKVDSVDIPQPCKVNLISLGLIPDTPSYILLYPTNPEPFFLSYQTNPESIPYFLPFPETSSISRTIRLHFVEVSMLHTFIEHIRFATYFWHTLWHLVGVHAPFSSACHPPNQGTNPQL